MSRDSAKLVLQARKILQNLGFDAERTNERSALVLLALSSIKPGDSWTKADNPEMRTVEIIEKIASDFSRTYKPNSRETIRRQTLHQFVDSGLVLINPDSPVRPVNSPKTCYQLSDSALGLLRAFESKSYEQVLKKYLATNPGLAETYSAQRLANRIPVSLPNGDSVSISPGGQNTLLKLMVEEFCSIFTPGGQVLYLGDADSKWAIFEYQAFKQLGISLDSHGKMPDLVVYLPDKNWLCLLEAASSHGPVDAKRHRELLRLFSDSSAGLVFVSCFPTRAEMRKYLSNIAWESEVWCADSPTHLIHFNGERFLGPYS